MKYLVLFSAIFSALPQAQAAAPTPEKVLLFRKILVKECRSPKKCLEVVSDQKSPAKVEISIANAGKGRALHGEDHLRVEAKGVPFKADLFVNIVRGQPHVYAVLRSGKGTKRNGVTKKFLLAGPSMEPIALTDRTILIDGKSYQAELIVGPAEIASNAQKSISLGIRFSRGGKTVCETRREVKNREDTFFCEGQALGNPAVVRVRAAIIPPTEEQRKIGASLDQVDVATYAVEKVPNGAPLESKPEIIALDNEKAEMEINTTPPADSMHLEVTPYVIW